MDEWLDARLVAHPILTIEDRPEVEALAFGLAGFARANVDHLDKAVDALSALTAHWERLGTGHTYIDRHARIVGPDG